MTKVLHSSMDNLEDSVQIQIWNHVFDIFS
jgi:hypothetical protein